MSQHKRKITIRVTAQTAYHLEQMAKHTGTTPGQIVDRLVAHNQRVRAKTDNRCLTKYRPG